jgi:putative transcriptional regulator
MRLLPANRRILRASRPIIGAAVLLATLISANVPPIGRATGSGTSAVQLHRNRVRDLAVGKCLVAARDLPDPNFGDSVVLLADYSEKGAMGLIINRPTDLQTSRVLGDLKGAQGRTDTIYFGGPVSVDAVVALFRSKVALPESRRVLGDVHMITTREPLEAIFASRIKPSDLRMYLGYAGWGPRQLDRETALGSWHVLPAEAELVFDPDPDSVWLRQIRRTERLIVFRGLMAPSAEKPLA